MSVDTEALAAVLEDLKHHYKSTGASSSLSPAELISSARDRLRLIEPTDVARWRALIPYMLTDATASNDLGHKSQAAFEFAVCRDGQGKWVVFGLSIANVETRRTARLAVSVQGPLKDDFSLLNMFRTQRGEDKSYRNLDAVAADVVRVVGTEQMFALDILPHTLKSRMDKVLTLADFLMYHLR